VRLAGRSGSGDRFDGHPFGQLSQPSADAHQRLEAILGPASLGGRDLVA
jgi:hypothetical protein